jgi:hypothetical protein
LAGENSPEIFMFSLPTSNSSLPPALTRLKNYDRLGLFLLGSLLFGLLGTAALLKPASAGFGTHEQLGLPPCTVKLIFGMRCPACGMTTSWSHLMHGELLESFRANCGGSLMGILAMIGGMGCFVAVFRGCVPARGRFAEILLMLTCVSLVVALVEWVIRLIVSH